MTSLPAAPAMTMLAGATHPDALSEAVTVVARRRVANAVADPLAIAASGTTEVRPKAVLAVVPTAKASGAAAQC